MLRFHQLLLILSTIALGWLAMMGVHELGHVISATASGGTVTRVVLHPLSFSRTDVTPNPHPLFVGWGGAVWGCLIPLALLAVVRATARSHTYLAAFFAAFCLIANGVYLAVGSFFPDGDDAGVIMAAGGPHWTLVLFGLITVPAGLYLLNGLGPHFGLGAAAGNVDRRAAIAVTFALVVWVVAASLLSG